jgi:methyl-accepting chemotaxis protein
MNIIETFNRLSLKKKAAAFSVALGTIPVLLCGTTAYLFASNNIQKTEEDNVEFISESLSSELGRFLSIRVKDINIIAGLPMFNNPSISKVIQPQQKNLFLSNFLKNYTFYNSILYADINGNVIYKSQGQNPSNIKERQYFQQVIKTNNAVITNVETSTSTGEKVIHIAAPVKEKGTGKLLGVVRARMPVESLKMVAEKYGDSTNDISATLEWHIIDKSQEKFVLAKEAEQVGRKFAEDFANLPKLLEKGETSSTIDIDRLDGKQQLVAYSPLDKQDDLKDLDMGIVIAENLSEIEDEKQGVLWVILAGTGIAGVAATSASILLSNRATQFVQKIANAIASSSAEIATTVEQQDRTISEQASSVTETTTTVNELGSSSRQAAEQAEASASGARQALSLAENGTKAVQQTLSGMSSLKDKVNGIANQIVSLSQQTGQIANVSDLVADIANQTNMLALNAAVEAARAGESGKGFSVVAGEIRKLADQSKKSAEKINNLVSDIQAEINKTVMVTDEGTKTVDEGIRLAESTAYTFVGVSDSINNVFLNSQQISLSAKQQAVAIQQVLSAMNEINLGAKESAIGMNQVKSSTQELNKAATDLKESVV